MSQRSKIIYTYVNLYHLVIRIQLELLNFFYIYNYTINLLFKGTIPKNQTILVTFSWSTPTMHTDRVTSKDKWTNNEDISDGISYQWWNYCCQFRSKRQGQKWMISKSLSCIYYISQTRVKEYFIFTMMYYYRNRAGMTYFDFWSAQSDAGLLATDFSWLSIVTSVFLYSLNVIFTIPSSLIASIVAS